MLKKLQELNPTLRLYDVTDPAFAPYGRVLQMDVSEITAEAEKLEKPANGSTYLLSVPAFEALQIADEIKNAVFGTLDTQVGYCYGYSDTLNATEWHFSSELNIAVTPLVLILGQRADIKAGKLDSADMKAFYLPAGTVVEVYATATHFCPCQVQESGFGCVVALPKGTNTPLETPTADPLLFRRNKWLLAHEQNEGLIARGAVAGIFGENYKIKF